ncbi:MAG: proprotein convertase P-domain-containing protein [Sedimentisphaerales bacterium]
MDNHSRILRLWAAAGVIICIFQYSASAEGYYSFGRSINKPFGDPNLKNIEVVENIFVPITGKVLNIDLALNIEHTSICDLQIYLKSPAGTEVCINSYDYDIDGGRMFEPNRQNFYWTVFDAESPISIDSGKSPYCGLFRPNGPGSLTDFYGEQSYGTWQVRVKDWIYADTGTFKGVRLDFYINPEPSTVLLFAFSALIGISSGKHRPV